MMLPTKPVSVPRGAFAFCRYAVMVLVWAAFWLHSKELVVGTAIIMALSALLTVRRAPLVVFYSVTVEKILPSGMAILDEYGMRYAHLFATVVLTVSALLAYLGALQAAWVVLFILAVAKTISAVGFCPVSKAYTCLSRGGSCCGFMKNTSCELNEIREDVQ